MENGYETRTRSVKETKVREGVEILYERKRTDMKRNENQETKRIENFDTIEVKQNELKT